MEIILCVIFIFFVDYSRRPSESIRITTMAGNGENYLNQLSNERRRMLCILCRYGMGIIYYKQERYPMAEFYFKKAIKLCKFMNNINY